ncbi:MAG: xylose isomerase [Burkholderiaceae bacterium]
MSKELLFGITESGVMHTDAQPLPDLETKFRMVRDAGVYDYFDKTPPAALADDYQRLSDQYEIPILAGGWFYYLGKDEPLLEENLKLGARLGSRVHNTQIRMDHSNGHLVTDEEVAETYLWAREIGDKVGCVPTFEVHVNMWSEDFRRIAAVAELVDKRGVNFEITLDHSHVIFKIDNPREQQVFNIEQAIQKGELVLDPFAANNVCSQWIESGLVKHCHARAAVPNNPRNAWASHESLETLPSSLHPKELVGRGIQYPFIQPEPGQWHSEWHEEKLEPWKEVVRQLMHHHAHQSDEASLTISTEFIPNPDYGGGAKYSIFEHSVACARWLRNTWETTQHAPVAARR